MNRGLKLSLLSLLWIGLSTWPTVLVVAKKDRNQPQGHFGILTPYKPGPFETTLSKSDEKLLADGKPVMKQTLPTKEDPEGGGALCVQDIEAPKAAVWNQILDLGAYKGKVPKIIASKNYVDKKNPDGTNRIKTRLVIGVMPGYSYESYYDHIYHPRESSMTWTLDYEKTSDFEDVAGHWHVEDHPTKPNACRVFYACDVKMKASVPGPILNYLSKQALKQATGWVKKESEKNPDARPASQYAVPEESVAGGWRR